MKWIFLTGSPGCGKTTALLKSVNLLQDRGFSVGGFVSQEAREGGSRVGFRLRDLMTNESGWLAHVTASGPQFGRYRISLEGIQTIACRALARSLEDPKITIIAMDEIGPMELTSNEFVDMADKVLSSDRSVIGTVHSRARHRLIDRIKKSPNGIVIELNPSNRDLIPEKILRMLRDSA